jgi:hypothetical protein
MEDHIKFVTVSISLAVCVGFGITTPLAYYDYKKVSQFKKLSFEERLKWVERGAAHIECFRRPEYPKWPTDPAAQEALVKDIRAGICYLNAGFRLSALSSRQLTPV